MKTKELSSGMKILAVISAVLMILIGFSLVFVPGFIIWLFSVAVFIHGIQLVIQYFTMKGARRRWDIISGIINILFGALMLFGGAETVVMGVLTMEIFIAIWVLFAGFSFIFNSFELKREKSKKWWYKLVGGALMVFCGLLIVSAPAAAAIGMVFAIGVFAGVAFIMTGFTELAGLLSGKEASEE